MENMFLTPEVIDVFSQIALILGVFFFGKILIRSIIDKAVKPLLSKSKKAKIERKRKTITRTLRLIGNLILYSVITILLLRLTGITTTSLLAGAGFTGLIFGLFAQSIIRDMLTGLFILGEDQFDIGDTIEVNEIKGVVKDVTIRSLVLQTKKGERVYIPHGWIRYISNRSKKKSS